MLTALIRKNMFVVLSEISWPEVPEEMSYEAHDIISKLLNPKYDFFKIIFPAHLSAYIIALLACINI